MNCIRVSARLEGQRMVQLTVQPHGGDAARKCVSKGRNLWAARSEKRDLTGTPFLWASIEFRAGADGSFWMSVFVAAFRIIGGGSDLRLTIV